MTPPSEEDRQVLSLDQVEAEDLPDWRMMLGAVRARFRTGDFATGLALVAEVGALAEEMDHHPDLDLSYGRLDVRLASHDVGGVTRRDVRLARAVSAAAARLGATAAPGEVTALELALDTPDHDEVKAFWAALLGYAASDSAPDELADPDGTRPTLWFQPSGRDAEVPSQRFHLDVWVPPEVARERVAAAVAAGGELVDDTEAPSYWVLADRQGNRACVCTVLDRD